MFAKRYGAVFEGDERWQAMGKAEPRLTYNWNSGSTYVQNPPYFEDMQANPPPISDVVDARVLGLFLDSITTDHISPAGSIKSDGPAGVYLIEHQVRPAEFNSYGARRGNHNVMMRGTFANIRIKNMMLGGKEGGMTDPLSFRRADVDLRRRHALQGGGRAAGRVRGQGVRHRLEPRLGGKGHAPARHPRRDRAVVRAHPPLQPGRHGRAAARVRGRPVLAGIGTNRHREDEHSAAWRTSNPGRSC